MQAVCLQIGGATSSPTPAFFFLSCTRPRQVSSCQQKQNPYGPFSEPVNGGGGCAPFFLHEHCIISKTCFALIVIDLFKYHRAGSLFANGGAAFPPTPGLAKTEATWTFSTPHAGSLFANGGATSPPTPRFFKLCKKTSSIILPAKPEPIWTGSEPVLKTLCLQTGGGGPAPPPTPLLSFYAVPACFQEHRTMNKNWFKHIEVIDLFKNHHARSLFANGAAASPEAIWTLSEPVTCVCKWRGLRPPPTPLFLFTPCRLAFKNIAPSARLASRAQLL